MKILIHSAYKDEVESAKLLLAVKGIPTFIGGESYGPSLGFALANKYTIWVCLDDQYDDALSILNNAEYEPRNPVDMIKFQDYMDKGTRDLINKVFYKVITAGAIGIVFFTVFS